MNTPCRSCMISCCVCVSFFFFCSAWRKFQKNFNSFWVGQKKSKPWAACFDSRTIPFPFAWAASLVSIGSHWTSSRVCTMLWLLSFSYQLPFSSLRLLSSISPPQIIHRWKTHTIQKKNKKKHNIFWLALDAIGRDKFFFLLRQTGLWLLLLSKVP